MTVASSGQQAEQTAAQYLQNMGYKIIDQNWKTPLCEIDIVASKVQVTYFVEVKYRATESAGTGLEYITSKKQKHMARAAEMWVQAHDHQGDYQLAALEVAGPNFSVQQFIEL